MKDKMDGGRNTTRTRKALRVQDISGLASGIFHKMDKVERLLQDMTYDRGSRVQRIDHVNCSVPDVQKASDFYINELGFACSEDTVDETGKLWETGYTENQRSMTRHL